MFKVTPHECPHARRWTPAGIQFMQQPTHFEVSHVSERSQRRSLFCFKLQGAKTVTEVLHGPDRDVTTYALGLYVSDVRDSASPLNECAHTFLSLTQGRHQCPQPACSCPGTTMGLQLGARLTHLRPSALAHGAAVTQAISKSSAVPKAWHTGHTGRPAMFQPCAEDSPLGSQKAHSSQPRKLSCDVDAAHLKPKQGVHRRSPTHRS